jgi:hypothetical protein
LLSGSKSDGTNLRLLDPTEARFLLARVIWAYDGRSGMARNAHVILSFIAA